MLFQSYRKMRNRIQMCVHTCMGTCAMERPEVDVRGLPQLFSVSLFNKVFHESRAHLFSETGWPANTRESFFLYLSSVEMTGVYHSTCFVMQFLRDQIQVLKLIHKHFSDCTISLALSPCQFFLSLKYKVSLCNSGCPGIVAMQPKLTSNSRSSCPSFQKLKGIIPSPHRI